ncbi:MAG: radical SAM protein [Actinomycetota bacterium]|nr:radical SAM protein [Actinomycetota bacterium]
MRIVPGRVRRFLHGGLPGVGLPCTIDLAIAQEIVLPLAAVPPGSGFMELQLQLDLPWDETGRYEHSKLYYATAAPWEFSEERNICLHVAHVGRVLTMRVVLPPAVCAAGRVRLRLDPAPGSHAGTATLHALRFVPAATDDAVSRAAGLEDLKDRTRRELVVAEHAHAEVVPVLPHSLVLELTARCNLTCTHCSSHGTQQLHLRHNRMAEMPVERFERLADEVFPSLTTFGLVGRGEPLIASDRLWRAVVRKLVQHQVRLTLVTNGCYVTKRITPDVVERLETIHISVDGGTPETFAANRGGASLDETLAALAHVDRLRRAAGLARRPRIGVSWTLKANNVHELPAFVERAVGLGIDQLTVRHLLVFHGHNRDESLVDRPDLVNGPLGATYEILHRHGVRSDCPPLMQEGAPSARSAPVTDSASSSSARDRDGCLFIHRTAVVHSDGLVPTCGAHFSAAAGHLEEEPSFAAIWNGPVLRRVRATLDTPDELAQCTNCWYREGRYQSQRQAFDDRIEEFDLSRPDQFTQRSWNFEDFEQ